MTSGTERWAEAKDKMQGPPYKPGHWLEWELAVQPEHLAFVLARYRAASALIGNAREVVELGCGEGVGADILAHGRARYLGVDSDLDAIQTAVMNHIDHDRMMFGCRDILKDSLLPYSDAVVMLDVIEHIPAEAEEHLLAIIRRTLRRHGVFLVGTPNQAAEHLASDVARAGHVNLYSADRLRELLSKHFRLVQTMGMQDTSVHFGRGELAHYLLGVGVGPK